MQTETWIRFRRSAVSLLVAVALLLACPLAVRAAGSKTDALWFDPTQLPSFTGVVDRFLPDPDGHVDRLIFKEGSQIVFPPDAFEAIRQAAPVGRPLVVWGIRARTAPVITMLAFAVPDGEPSVLDRFYWRPEQGHRQGRRNMMLIGKVWTPYLSPQGKPEGAILQNGDVVRVDPAAGAALKDRFAAGATIVAAGTGTETPFGKAVEADRIGDTVATLEPLPHWSSETEKTGTGDARPRQ